MIYKILATEDGILFHPKPDQQDQDVSKMISKDRLKQLPTLDDDHLVQQYLESKQQTDELTTEIRQKMVHKLP